MYLIPVIGVLFTVAVALTILGLTMGSSMLADKLVGQRHRDLEFIAESGQVPPGWRESYERKIARLQRDPRNVERIARLREEAERGYLKRIDSLIHYVDASELVDTEETRQLLLDKLSAAREAWEREENSD